MEEPVMDEDEEFEQDGLSLEELSQSYATVLGNSAADGLEREPNDGPNLEVFDPLEDDLEGDLCAITPTSIIEAILFVGRQDSKAISASEIAALMRGVSPSEVEHLVAELNEVYQQSGRAICVVEEPSGYKIELVQELTPVRDRFYGETRDVRLNQAAIDCLALVSYQPGISREKLEEQRGQPSSGVLNQLVRRELLEMRREGPGKVPKPHYYPTQRLLELTGLSSLDDLPRVEEWQ